MSEPPIRPWPNTTRAETLGNVDLVRGVTLMLAVLVSGGVLTAIAVVALEAFIGYIVVAGTATAWLATTTDTGAR